MGLDLQVLEYEGEYFLSLIFMAGMKQPKLWSY